MVHKFAAALLALSYVTLQTEAQTYQSPCPRLFVYEPRGTEPDKWYGILTLLTDADLNGVWLRVMLDRPSLQLGNWFGEVVVRENNEYLIKNRNHKLKANVPETLRFYIKYNTAEPVPQLVGFRLNAVTKCPEGGYTTAAPTSEAQLITSSELVTTPMPQLVRPHHHELIKPEGGSNAALPPNGGGPSAEVDDDFFHGDFNPGNYRPGFGHKRSIECGTVAVQPRPLISYGEATHEGEFPWHAALYHTKGAGLNYICGGSLISNRHVVTVGHCITRPRSDITLNPENLLIYLGKYYLKKWSNPGIQDHTVTRIIRHPQYNPDTFANDIAIIKLANIVEYTDYVRPICMWQGPNDINSIIGKYGVVVGWGFNENGVLTETLTKINMPVVSKETCVYSFSDFFSHYTTPETYCAGFKNGTSVCNGDSGGGMIFPKETNTPHKTVWQLRGLVSISVALQNEFKCNPKHYIVFTDLVKYLDFIKAAMAL